VHDNLMFTRFIDKKVYLLFSAFAHRFNTRPNLVRDGADISGSAQWRNQIMLLSMATTSIYWSSRLDRADQLQQSAAIFSRETRRVAVYLETHCNIHVDTKRAFPTGELTYDTTVYLFTNVQAVKFLYSTIPSGTC